MKTMHFVYIKTEQFIDPLIIKFLFVLAVTVRTLTAERIF